MGDDNHSDGHGAKHEHGTMDIEVQEKTFELFLAYVGRGMAVSVIALILLYIING